MMARVRDENQRFQPLIKRDGCKYGYQNGWRSSNQRKETHHPDMQARTSPALLARPQHAAGFPANHQRQQNQHDAIDRHGNANHLLCRFNRCQAQQNNEGTQPRTARQESP